MNFGENSVPGTSQSVEIRQNSCNASASVCRRKDLTQQVKGNQSTMDPIVQILEKLSAVDQHFANLTAKVNQQ